MKLIEINSWKFVRNYFYIVSLNNLCCLLWILYLGFKDLLFYLYDKLIY